MKRVNFHLTENQIIALKHLSQATGLKGAEIIRRLLDRAIANRKIDLRKKFTTLVAVSLASVFLAGSAIAQSSYDTAVATGGWYVNADGANCGPLNLPIVLDRLQRGRTWYAQKDVKENGRVVESSLILMGNGSPARVTFYRSKERCEDELLLNRLEREIDMKKYE